jgi:predicted outer membrane lipoprotein
LHSSFFFHNFARSKPKTKKFMKKNFVWLLGVFVACCFTLTALAACGDDDDDAIAGSGEACIVAVLPNSVAPYANLEVTYYDAQGNARNFTVRDGGTSDDVPSYAKEAVRNLELQVGYTIEYSKCIIHTVKFAVPVDKKITCSYKVVLNGTPVTTYPDKVFAPFAVVTGKRSNGETLSIQGSSSLGYKTLTSAEAFKTWLDTIKEKERESYIVMN